MYKVKIAVAGVPDAQGRILPEELLKRQAALHPALFQYNSNTKTLWGKFGQENNLSKQLNRNLRK